MGGVLLLFGRLQARGKGWRMIPRVRPWLVRFIRDGATVAEVKVETVNRRFARWLALEQFPAGHLIGTRATVSRMK